MEGYPVKTGDMVRNKQPGTTIIYITGLILDIFPNGTMMYPEMLAKLLWSNGHQTVEFLEDLKVYFEVISESR